MNLIPTKNSAELEEYYSTLPPVLVDIYRRRDVRINSVGQSFLTDMGRELKELQDEVASHDKTLGSFGKWIELKGMKSRTAYNLINRYDYLLQNLQDIDAFEALPKSLSYEVSKPSALPEANEAVFNGEVKTLKEYKELEARLKAEQDEKEKLSRQLNESKQALDFALSAPPKVIEKEVILENPKLIETISELEAAKRDMQRKLIEAENAKASALAEINKYKATDTEYKEKEKQILEMNKQILEYKKHAEKNNIQMNALDALMDFNRATDQFIKENTIKLTFQELENNPFLSEIKLETQKRFQLLFNWIQIHSQKLEIEYEQHTAF